MGTNCGGGGREAITVISAFKKDTGLPLWAKPNAGRPQIVRGKTVFPESPEETADQAEELVKAGARFIGGCCGTTPEHIKAIKERCGNLRS